MFGNELLIKHTNKEGVEMSPYLFGNGIDNKIPIISSQLIDPCHEGN